MQLIPIKEGKKILAYPGLVYSGFEHYGSGPLSGLAKSIYYHNLFPASCNDTLVP